MIAVGVGRLFGFELVQNFKQPYFAKNLTDFWRRWHISFEQLAAGLYLYSAGRRQKGTCSQTAQYTACFSHQRSVAWRRAAVFGMGTAAWCRTGRAGFLQKGEASGIRGRKNWPGKAAAYAFGSADLFYGDVFLDLFPQRIGIDGSDLSEKYVYQVERISVLETVFVHDGIGKNAVFVAIAGIAVLFGIDLISEKRNRSRQSGFIGCRFRCAGRSVCFDRRSVRGRAIWKGL